MSFRFVKSRRCGPVVRSVTCANPRCRKVVLSDHPRKTYCSIGCARRRKILKNSEMVKGRTDVACIRCGETKPVVHSRKAGRKFCSLHCWYEWRKENNVRPSCKLCGNPCADLGRRFCSRKCASEFGQRSNTCIECSAVFTTKRSASQRKFCSHRCAAIRNKKEVQTKPCAYCGKIFTPKAPARATKGRFCSRECAQQNNRGSNSVLYRGNRRQDRGPDWQPQARLARQRDGNICQCCNLAPTQKASVDHIVPYRLARQICNDIPLLNPNDLINLICLCRSCHGKKTPAETTILRGDVLGFIATVKMIIPPERLIAAMQLYGLHQ